MAVLAARFVTMSEHLRKCHAMVRDRPQSWWMDAVAPANHGGISQVSSIVDITNVLCDTKQGVPNYENFLDDRVTFHNKGSAAVKASSKTGTFSGRFQ